MTRSLVRGNGVRNGGAAPGVCRGRPATAPRRSQSQQGRCRQAFGDERCSGIQGGVRDATSFWPSEGLALNRGSTRSSYRSEKAHSPVPTKVALAQMPRPLVQWIPLIW